MLNYLCRFFWNHGFALHTWESSVITLHHWWLSNTCGSHCENHMSHNKDCASLAKTVTPPALFRINWQRLCLCALCKIHNFTLRPYFTVGKLKERQITACPFLRQPFTFLSSNYIPLVLPLQKLSKVLSTTLVRTCALKGGERRGYMRLWGDAFAN